MTARTAIGIVILNLCVAVPAAQEAHQHGAPASASGLTPCEKVQPIVRQLIADASEQLEQARQTNDPARLRSAIAAFDAALRDLKTQLAPCDAPAAADPHAGHAMQASQTTDLQVIEQWLNAYDAAFNAKDLDRLATFYHPDVTIYEGTGVNNGWADYRDRHLGPELRSFEDLQFGHSNRRVQLLGDRAAYVVSEYFIKAKMKDRMLDNIGRETLVLEKQPDGSWRIRHSHTSGRARPQK